MPLTDSSGKNDGISSGKLTFCQSLHSPSFRMIVWPCNSIRANAPLVSRCTTNSASVSTGSLSSEFTGPVSTPRAVLSLNRIGLVIPPATGRTFRARAENSWYVPYVPIKSGVPIPARQRWLPSGDALGG